MTGEFFRLKKNVYVNVSPTNPKFLGFYFTQPNVDMVQLIATSADSACMTLSIQPPEVSKI